MEGVGMVRDPLPERASDIRMGLAVYSKDGRELGHVQEVLPDAIKVDAPLRIDYWIRREDVLSFTAERVTLNFPAELLDRYATSIPPHGRW
jgi:hypothetical protein